MATTIKTRIAGSTMDTITTTARYKAQDVFQATMRAANVDSVEVFNSQGHRFLAWNRWQGQIICEEPLPERAANSRHNRRRK